MPRRNTRNNNRNRYNNNKYNNKNTNNNPNNEDNNTQIIMGLNNEDLNNLLTAINKMSILISDLNINENKYLTDLNLYKTQIDGLKQTINAELPEYLQDMAQVQMDNALTEKDNLEQEHKTVMTQHNDNIRKITNLFPNYDWNIDMTEVIIDRINHFEKLKSIELSRIKTEQLALLNEEKEKLIISQKAQLLNDKKYYVINKCIPYLFTMGNFTPDLSRLTHSDYLDKLISDAHRFHYRDICRHNINLDEDNKDNDVFTYKNSIRSCNGWYQHSYKTVYDDETGKVIESPCCHRRYCFGVSKDILKFSNLEESFNLDTTECMCQDGIEYKEQQK